MEQRCLEICDACADMIDWIEVNRRQSPRLDRESATLTLRLRRGRIKAKTLARTAGRPYAVGFFGLSQAGKSYLISAFAANAAGRLDILLGAQRLNFLVHINPPGGGKEATGLVTRFTRCQNVSPRDFPVRLSLFSEVDLVKVLGNAFFKDFDREKAPFDVDEDKLRTRLADLQAKRRRDLLPGIDADHMVELRDYFEKHFPRSSDALKADFWPTASTLATHLDGDDRATLFSILWGDVPELTATFKLLRDFLARLQFATTVHSEISALVTPTGNGDWTPSASIIDVDILERLGKDMGDTLRVLPSEAARAVEAVSVPRSVLAALTTEMELVLADPPRAELLEHVDLLDFPGYRGRLSIGGLDDVRRQLRDEQLDPVAQLVLRGKVAYLFERYTDNQEMNALVMCTPSNQQSDVSDLGPVLQTWIETTQGANPETRAQQRPGLLWALTKFDQRLDVVPGQSTVQMTSGWEGMMKLTLLERFGTYDWLHEWKPGRRFDNLFLVRKPGKAGAVIVTKGEQELEFQGEQTKRLELLRKTFCENSLVRKHIRDPGVAWDAMLTLNDGGIARLTEQLSLAADPKARLRRIREQIEALASDLANRLKGYYRAQGAAATADKERIVVQIIKRLSRRPKRIGDLIYVLQPSHEQLRALYLRTDNEVEIDQGGVDAALDLPDEEEDSPLDIEDIIGESGSMNPEDVPDHAARFARDVIRTWVSQIKELADQEYLRAYFGLTREAFEDLIDELVIGAERHGLEQAMTEALKQNEDLAGARREQIAARQVDAVFAILADFIDRLEAFQTRAVKHLDQEAEHVPALFAPVPTIGPGELPELPPEPDPFSERFIRDWFRALKEVALNNADYATDQEFTPEQNRRLGEILAVLESEVPDVPDIQPG